MTSNTGTAGKGYARTRPAVDDIRRHPRRSRAGACNRLGEPSIRSAVSSRKVDIGLAGAGFVLVILAALIGEPAVEWAALTVAVWAAGRLHAAGRTYKCTGDASHPHWDKGTGHPGSGGLTGAGRYALDVSALAANGSHRRIPDHLIPSPARARCRMGGPVSKVMVTGLAARLKVRCLILTLLANALLFAVHQAPASAASCDPILLTLNGSSQAYASAENARITSTVKGDAAAEGVGVVAQTVYYPAEPVSRYLRPNHSLDWSGLGLSEARGRTALRQVIASAKALCSSRAILLAGYSQGADVISAVVNGMNGTDASTVSVAMIGNPSFQPLLSQDYGSYNTGRRGIRLALRQIAYPIISPSVRSRTIDGCLKGDPICNFYVPDLPGLSWPLNNSAHYKYVRSGYADAVAHRLWAMRTRSTPGSVTVTAWGQPASVVPLGTELKLDPSQPCPSTAQDVTVRFLDATGIRETDYGDIGLGADGSWSWRYLAPKVSGAMRVRVSCVSSYAGPSVYDYADTPLMITDQLLASTDKSSYSAGDSVTLQGVTACPAPAGTETVPDLYGLFWTGSYWSGTGAPAIVSTNPPAVRLGPLTSGAYQLTLLCRSPDYISSYFYKTIELTVG